MFYLQYFGNFSKTWYFDDNKGFESEELSLQLLKTKREKFPCAKFRLVFYVLKVLEY